MSEYKVWRGRFLAITSPSITPDYAQHCWGCATGGIGLTEVMLLWMAGYFSGVVRSPLTVAAILFEMTGAYGMILPLMLVSMIASLIAGRLCEPSIYDALATQFLRRLGLEDPEVLQPPPSGSR